MLKQHIFIYNIYIQAYVNTYENVHEMENDNAYEYLQCMDFMVTIFFL